MFSVASPRLSFETNGVNGVYYVQKTCIISPLQFTERNEDVSNCSIIKMHYNAR